MSAVYFLRPGTGMQRIASREDAVDLYRLETLTRTHGLLRLLEAELPAFGTGPASNRHAPQQIVVHVRADETTGRFDRPGFWLFESLQPHEYRELMEADTNSLRETPRPALASDTR